MSLESERILPCLLERLTDHYPRASKESREHRTVGLRQYRESVLRDLSWLFNTETQSDADAFGGLERVQASVLNYGIDGLVGCWLAGHEVSEVAAFVREAILRFEPRIIRETLSVRVVDAEEGEGAAPGSVTLDVVGELWAVPMPEQLYIRTEVDLETGACNVSRS